MYVQSMIIKLRLRNFPFIVTLDMTILQFGWKVPIYGQCLSDETAWATCVSCTFGKVWLIYIEVEVKLKFFISVGL